MNPRQNQSGQTLLEAMIALSALLVVIAAIAIVVTNALNNAQFLSDQNRAAKYAQQGIEFLRDFRNTDYDAFSKIGFGVGLCLPDQNGVPVIPSPLVQSNLITHCTVNAGAYKREFRLDNNPSDCPQEIRATVTVYWTSTKCPPTVTASSDTYCHSTVMTACLSNAMVPAPNL